MSFTEALEKALLDLVWGGSAYSAAANLYIGLSTTAINNDGTASQSLILDAYARLRLRTMPLSGRNATRRAVCQTEHANELSFPTATDSWGTVTHFFFSTDPTSTDPEDIIAFGALDVPRTIEENDTASFAANAITITLD